MAITTDSISEMKLLMRSIKPPIFRIIIVRSDHRQVADEVAEQIQRVYPNRMLKRIRTENKNYHELMQAIYQQGSGVLIIEDFQYILSKPEVYVAFNQRRDKIAQFPISLICCIPTEHEVLQEMVKKLPDFWSFRNLVVEIRQEHPATELGEPLEPIYEVSTLGGTVLEEKEKELNRLIDRVDELTVDPSNISLITSYYPQILQLLEETGAYQRGLEYAEQFLQIAKENHSAQKPLDIYPDALNWKAKFYKYLGHYQEAKQSLEEALALDSAVYGEAHPRTTSRQSGLAVVYQEIGDYRKAKELLEKALTFDLNNYGEGHPDVAAKQSNLATVYQDLGDYEGARVLLEKALASGIAHYGTKNRMVAERYSSLALIYKDLGNLEKAKELLGNALAIDLSNYGDQHSIVATRQSNLATVYRSLKEYDRAKQLLESALASAEATYSANHPKVATRQSNLASVYMDLGEHKKARDLLERALTLQVTNYGDEHISVATIKANLAVAYEELKEYDQSRTLWTDAYHIFRRTLGENHPSTKTSKNYLTHLRHK